MVNKNGLVVHLIEKGKIGLDYPISQIINSVVPEEKKNLTPCLLLCHSAGLAHWKPYYLDLIDYPLDDRKQVLREWIIKEPLSYTPGEGCLYSDLGFMLMEWLIEEAAGMPMARFLRQNVYGPIGLKRTFFLTESPPSQFQK